MEDEDSAVEPLLSDFGSPVSRLLRSGNLSPPANPRFIARLGDFHIIKLLGQGGMGVVFKAIHTCRPGVFAIKLARPEWSDNPDVLGRFLDEAAIQGRLRHPHIAPLLETGGPDGPIYLVMPYYPLGSLNRRLSPRKPVDEATTFRVAGQVADGLSYAHGKGIIHHDLNPANILFETEHLVRVSDFGLARFFDGWLHNPWTSGLCEGTIPYMSPLVAANQAEDTRCDIYSFGAVLYEMLTGMPPYQGATAVEIKRQIVSGPPADIFQLNPQAHPKLAAVARRAMARDHRDRYASMEDVAQEIARIRPGDRSGLAFESERQGPPMVPESLEEPVQSSRNRWMRICLFYRTHFNFWEV